MPTDQTPDPTAAEIAALLDAVPPVASPTEPAPKRRKGAKGGWNHPTKARVKDEAKARFGKKSRVVNFRLSEPEWEALHAAMAAAGAKKVSAYVRHLCLTASADHLPAASTQAVPVPYEPPTTAASAGDDDIARWLAAQTDTAAPPLFDLPAPAPPAPVMPLAPASIPVAPAWVVPATIEAPPAPPVPSRIVPATVTVADLLTPPPPVVTPPPPPMNLALLRQLRDLMGDDSRVSSDVLRALDAEDRAE